MKICPKCQRTVNSDYLFCPHCGENLKYCHHCGKELPDEAIYCPYCGKAIKATISNDLQQNQTTSTQQTPPETIHTNKPLTSVEAVLHVISNEARADIKKRFLLMRNELISSSENQEWTETDTQISLSDKWEHWVGHEDTLTKTIKLTFSKVWIRVENVPWTTESEWPCSGQALIFDKSWSKSDTSWDAHYTYVTHQAWLLKEPYGMPGLWRFEYMSSDSRD